jgi:hypothetical protein
MLVWLFAHASKIDTHSTGRGKSAVDIEQTDGVLDRTLVERRDD